MDGRSDLVMCWCSFHDPLQIFVVTVVAISVPGGDAASEDTLDGEYREYI